MSKHTMSTVDKLSNWYYETYTSSINKLSNWYYETYMKCLIDCKREDSYPVEFNVPKNVIENHVRNLGKNKYEQRDEVQ